MNPAPPKEKRQPIKKIVGSRGQWIAEVDGRTLAVLHNTWRVGGVGYYDPMKGVKTEGRKYRRLVEALKANEVAVMQRDAGDEIMSRDGYIGLFSFKDLEIGDDGSISLTLVHRVQ